MFHIVFRTDGPEENKNPINYDTFRALFTGYNYKMNFNFDDK